MVIPDAGASSQDIISVFMGPDWQLWLTLSKSIAAVSEDTES